MLSLTIFHEQPSKLILVYFITVSIRLVFYRIYSGLFSHAFYKHVGYFQLGSFFFNNCVYALIWEFPGGLYSKESTYNVGDLGLLPGLRRSSAEGNCNPLQYSCLENLMGRGAWRAAVHGVTKSRMWWATNIRIYQKTIHGWYHEKFQENFQLFKVFACKMDMPWRQLFVFAVGMVPQTWQWRISK